MVDILAEKCCEKCTHSAANPCPDLIDCLLDGKLCHESDKCRDARTKKLRRVIKGGDVPRIVIGMGTCGIAAGAQKIKDAFVQALEQQGVRAEISQTGCIGYCQVEVLVDLEVPGLPRLLYGEMTPEKAWKLVEAIREKQVLTDSLVARLPARSGVEPQGFDEIPFLYDTPRYAKQKIIAMGNCGLIDPDSIDEYIAHGGYRALSMALRSGDPAGVVEQVKLSGLRGRGGGGFPTGRKWEFTRNAPGDTKYIICNADEGDPGAFMDRSILEGDPHRVIEGMIIAGYAIGARKGYLYVRAEYPLAVERLGRALDQARQYGLLGTNILGSGFSFELEIKKGAGAFVCGEETALIASIEGKRGMPRPRPPYPAVSGLFGCPTNINNVETYANVSTIVARGAEWFSSIGTEGSKGTKVFAVTGKVKNTGLVEVPMGTTLREVIFDICGGMLNDDKGFKAVQIGGPSGGCIPESLLDTPVDYDSLIKVGAMMGSGGMVVMDEDTCMVDIARFFLDFTQHESCGKCIPCREGTKRMLEILERIVRGRQEETPEQALERFTGVMYLQRLAGVIRDTSQCGLGQTAPNPVLSTLRYFRNEYDAHIYDRKCPAGACKSLLAYRINSEMCKGCGLCARKCPEQAIVGEKRNPYIIIEDKCIKCGVCIHTCPFDAVYAD